MKPVTMITYITLISGSCNRLNRRYMVELVHPNQACYNYLVLCCRPSPLAYPTDSTILLLTSYLPIKLVARQQSTIYNTQYACAEFIEKAACIPVSKCHITWYKLWELYHGLLIL